MKEDIFHSCIYTIRHSDWLRVVHASGGSGDFTEQARWATGSQLLHDASDVGQRVPILFAPAEAIDGITYWAMIDDISLTSDGTAVRFSSLQPLPKRRPLSSLKKLSNNEPLSNNFIRPYVPCRTPPFLYSLASRCDSAPLLPDIDEADDISGREGALSIRPHLLRERDRTITAAKRRQVLSATGRLACSVCRFDFHQFYGELGAEFCEVHHLRALSEADGEVQTRLDDLAVVCSNCHRMLHRGRPLLTLEQVKSKIRKA